MKIRFCKIILKQLLNVFELLTITSFMAVEVLLEHSRIPFIMAT